MNNPPFREAHAPTLKALSVAFFVLAIQIIFNWGFLAIFALPFVLGILSPLFILLIYLTKQSDRYPSTIRSMAVIAFWVVSIGLFVSALSDIGTDWGPHNNTSLLATVFSFGISAGDARSISSVIQLVASAITFLAIIWIIVLAVKKGKFAKNLARQEQQPPHIQS